MISDVLFDAVEGIDGYLNDETFDTCYGGELRTEILILRNQMDRMRAKLDRPPVEPLEK